MALICLKMWKEIWYNTVLQFMLLNMLQNIRKYHPHNWLLFLAPVQETLQLFLQSVKIWTFKISLAVNSRNKKMFSCDMATWVAWHSAACVRGNLSPAWLPAHTYMRVHDSERQDDTLFRWFGIGRNNSHTDLPVVHWRQPVPACFMYERIMNRYKRSVTLVNWPGVPASASPHRVGCTAPTGNLRLMMLGKIC